MFCVQKKLQESLARHLGLIYDLNVPIINGDTKATSRHDPEETRLGLIEQFSRKEGSLSAYFPQLRLALG